MSIFHKINILPLFNCYVSRKSLESSEKTTRNHHNKICFSFSFNRLLLCFRDLSVETINERKRLLKKGSLQDLFVSSPPFEGENKNEINGVNLRVRPEETVHLVQSGGTGTSHGFRFGSLRRRFMRRSWRPALGAIPEKKKKNNIQTLKPKTKPQFPKLVKTTMALVRSSNIFDPFSLDLWDPFQDLIPSSFLRQNQSSGDEISSFSNPRMDWKETPEAHVFKADLPGVKKEEVKVEVEENRVLKISGERSKEKEDKNDRWHRVERSKGKFLRRFRLPENAKVEQVQAAMENGVLTVTVPKDVKKHEVKAIEIAG
ncbi:hypothetical protein LUZ60_009919 [Juncus effusus]|nr:hypothetical protein LUZ60_009919 [Juncus effusus]